MQLMLRFQKKELEMTLDEFFAEIADIKLELRFHLITTPLNISCGQPKKLCPICALALKKGRHFTNGKVQLAADFIGLSRDDATLIIAAADNDANADMTIRQRLVALTQKEGNTT